LISFFISFAYFSYPQDNVTHEPATRVFTRAA
jgi:hypothetical protein